MVLRLLLSMVATSPRSRISGESALVRENVLEVNLCRALEMVLVLRNPKPFRRSDSVNLILDGVDCKTVSTGRRRGVADCRVGSVRRWLCHFRMSLVVMSCWIVLNVSVVLLEMRERLRPSSKVKVLSLSIEMKPRRK